MPSQLLQVAYSEFITMAETMNERRTRELEFEASIHGCLPNK